MAHTVVHKNNLLEDGDILFLILTKPSCDISLAPSIDPLVCGMDVNVFSYFMPVCSIVKTITPRCRGRPDALLHEAEVKIPRCWKSHVAAQLYY